MTKSTAPITLAQLHAAKTIAIVGLGREGLSTLEFLESLSDFASKKIIILDQKPLEQLDQTWKSYASEDHIDFAMPSESKHRTVDVVIKSPGIHPDLLKETFHIASHIQTSNTQLFFEWLEEQPFRNKIKTIGITGTKGKSTSASLTHHLLSETGFASVIGGNIGTPPLSLRKRILRHFHSKSETILHIVLELSSHQLLPTRIQPNFSMLHAITPEHLDYYDSFQSYVLAKAQLCHYQSKSQHLFYNADDPQANMIAAQHCSNPVHHPVTSQPELTPETSSTTPVVYNEDIQNLTIKFDEDAVSHFNTRDLPLRGRHNYYNLAICTAVVHFLGAKPKQIEQSVQTFKPLPHRLQPIHYTQQISYINDSLATTPPATISALRSFPDQSIALIAGGYDRKQEYDRLANEILKQDVIAVALFPPTGNRLIKALQTVNKSGVPLPEFLETESMTEAVSWCTHQLQSKLNIDQNGIVLLSPAAASFSTFENYEDRGQQFTNAAQEIKSQ